MQEAPRSFDEDSLFFHSKGCGEEAMCSDVRRPSELRSLRCISQEFPANVLERYSNAGIVLHQNMCSLNPSLGKPDGISEPDAKSKNFIGRLSTVM